MRIKSIMTVVAVAMLQASGFTAPPGSVDHPGLAGHWRLDLVVEQPASGSPMPAVRQATVAVALLARTSDERFLWMDISGYTYYGAFSGDLRTLGMPRHDRERIPLAAARHDGDSVVVVLNPTRDHGSMVLRGGASNGRIGGRWTITGYAPGESGSFTMRRVD